MLVKSVPYSNTGCVVIKRQSIFSRDEVCSSKNAKRASPTVISLLFQPPKVSRTLIVTHSQCHVHSQSKNSSSRDFPKNSLTECMAVGKPNWQAPLHGLW